MSAANSQNNIVVIMADQLTAKAVGCYGNHEVITPHMDHLASQGVLFENAYSSSPLCTPARYAMMTGQNISRCGGYDNASYMPSTMPTFAHYLRMMGYRTCLSGKMHFVGSDQLHGFEERVTTDVYPADFGWMPDWSNPDERIDLWYHNMSSVKQAGVAAITNQLSYDDEVGAQSMRVIYDHARAEDERPLCLVASFIHPHDPYATRQKYWDMYEDVDIALPKISGPDVNQSDPHNQRLEKVIGVGSVDLSDEEIIQARRAYYGNVTYVDEWIGRLQDTLDECGLADNTTIIITADHGDMLGEYGLWYKMTFREWSCRIPMIIYDPVKLKPRVVKQPVSLVDVLPTLIDIAADTSITSGENTEGVEKPEMIDPVDGRSLYPLCLGDDANDPDRTVSEYLAEGTGAPMLMIRFSKYKFITCPTDPDQLFDLESDPDETNNLAADANFATLIQELREQSENHWDAEALRQHVIYDQTKRRRLHAALQIGKFKSWDYNPERDASEEYTRSHRDLTKFDSYSRYPMPVAFKPKY